jgi:CHAT domain-containing protein/tetratricopeptide (TPR) repeat protein
VAAATLAHIRDRHPADEIDLHTRAFAYYLSRLKGSVQSRGAIVDEDECLYHLDALFTLIGLKMEWQTILDDVKAVRDAGVAQARHQQRLDAYEGYAAIRIQQYDHGEQILTQLLEQAIVDPDVHLKALKGLADAAWYRSHYDRALDYHQQLHAAASAAGDRVYEGLALLNMGLVYYDLERYELALDHYTRSLEIFLALGDHAREAHARYHVALMSMYLGRWADAQEHSAAAARLFESLGLTNYLGFIYWMRGYLDHIFGDEAASEAAYTRALPLAESPQHGQPSLALDVWLYLGFLYHTQARWDMALQHYQQALAHATQLGRAHRLNLIHYHQGQVYQRQGRLDLALQAYQTAIEGVEALGGAMQGEDIQISLFGTRQQVYEATVLLCLELGRTAEAFHYIERARSRAFLDSLAKRSPELLAELDHTVLTLEDVQALLPAGALLLEYYTTGVLPRGEHILNSVPETNTRLREHLTLTPQVILFAITREHFEVHTPALNPNLLRPQIGDRYPGRHLLHARLPQYLYDRLVAPAAHLLDGSSVLYLIPHGPLHYVPFTALRSAAGDYLLHAQGPALALAPSATILLRNCLGRPPARGTGMLAIGFDDPLGDQPLRYAEAESRHVAQMFGGLAWTGMESKSQRLIENGRQARWLHIAGHARFNPHDPLGSYLLLGDDDKLDARAIIRDLELSVDLVTLSSCTSGVTHIVPGDELRGLQRALLYAGAPTVVCTRWEARDLVALLIMDHFYAGLRQGYTPAVALRDAQVAVREMTNRELVAQLDRWHAEGSDLAAVLGGVAEALHAAETATRELAGSDLADIFDRWRAEGGDVADAAGGPAAVEPITPDMRPFADPILWAPFMLVGRA